MAQTTVTFVISQDGTVTEKVDGVKGRVCESVTRAIEEKLGVVQRREHTSEYYESLVNEEVLEEYTHDSEGC